MLNETITPALLTAHQVAQILNISIRTLWRLKSAGQLPETLRVGNSVRWRNEDLRKWIEQGCQTPIPRDNSPRRKG